MTSAPLKELVLAVYPSSRGIAFTLFQAPLSLVDYGVKGVRSGEKNARSFQTTKELIDRLQPDVLVLESCAGPHGRRAERIRRLQRLIERYAKGQAIEVHTYTKKHIRECFSGVGAETRYEIAQAIAKQLQSLVLRLPPMRKLWMSEDARMGLFDAAALVMTFYCNAKDGVKLSGSDTP